MKNLITALLGSVFGAPRVPGIDRGRFRTCDQNRMAFPFRMPAGFPGDVNRTHPFSVEPGVNDPDDPVTFYGQAVVVDAANNSIRRVLAGDAALTKIYGVSVRPYPIQQSSGGMASSFGAATPPLDQPIDVLRSGYIMVPVVGEPTKGGPVYVWIAASDADHVQGGFEAEETPGSTILLADPVGSISFNGPPDEYGVTELVFNV